MHSWQFQMMPDVSDAAWIALLVVLVIVAVAALQYVARLQFFGGRWDSNLEPLDDQYIHGRINFEAYQEAKQEHAHVH
jgi:hypothetical protein